ncbi:MAG: alkylmercury lyase family protein [Actinoallomurus sp.]
MLELTVLTVPDCPNDPVITERLAEVLADVPDARLVRHVVQDEADAARRGMHGSPTLLVNGVDPFAAPDTPASVSCRIYRDETGHTEGAPSVGALRRAIEHATRLTAAPVLPDSVGRSGLGRLAPVDGGLRAVHQQVLRAFAENGNPPSRTELDDAAAPSGTTGRTVLGLLHAGDFLRLDEGGAVSAAYPFSATPTAHAVQVEDGPAAYSMCAIDALGIAAMLGKAVTIRSAEPVTGAPITVTVPAGNGRAVWEPAGAVVFVGQDDTRGCAEPDAEPDAAVPSVAADVCCGHINFFTSGESAAAWAEAHPEVTGQILSQRDALETGVQIFGPLLRTDL